MLQGDAILFEIAVIVIALARLPAASLVTRAGCLAS
jgi:hypothetical protein